MSSDASESSTPRVDDLLDFQNRRSMQVTPAIIALARQLERELAGLRADAERYRWLKDNHEELIYPDRWTPEYLDAAIDAAMKGKT